MMEAMMVARNTAPRAFLISQYARINHDDIGHGKEGSESGKDFRTDDGPVFLKFKEVFHG